MPERAFVKIDSADIRVHVYKVSEVSELRDFVPTSEGRSSFNSGLVDDDRGGRG